MIERLEFLKRIAKVVACYKRPERPVIGRPPARITYFTVNTASGLRCCSIDRSKNSQDQGARK